jgi:hypothetical protein
MVFMVKESVPFFFIQPKRQDRKRIKRMERIITDFFPPAADKDKPKASQSPFQSVQSVASVFYPVALVDDRKAKQMIRITLS